MANRAGASGEFTVKSRRGSFLTQSLLLLLEERPDHGYDLLDRMEHLGLARDSGGMYRTLRSLEAEGLVRSQRAPSLAGPERRHYSLTQDGRQRLDEDAGEIAETVRLLQRFLRRHRAAIALRHPTD